MKIELQNTMLSGQRTGRTINCHEDDGTEIVLMNCAVGAIKGGTIVLTVEHCSRPWPGSVPGVANAAQGATEADAAQVLVSAFLDATTPAEAPAS